MSSIEGIYKHYIIDMSSNNNFVQIPTVQGDGNNVRGFEIELISNGEQYVIDAANTYITIVGTKPDTKEIFNECTVTDEGYILVDITSQMSAVPGRSDYQIMIMDSDTNSQIKSFPFYIITTKAAFDIDKLVSTDEYQALTNTIAQAKKDYAYVMESAQASADAAKISETNARESEINAASSADIAASKSEAASDSALDAANSAASATADAQTASKKADEATASADIAGIKATEASNSAASASLSSSNSAGFATLSESWAIGGTGTRDGEDTDNSKYYATQTSSYAANAETYQTNAKIYMNNAASSATNASNSASVATTKASEASSSATASANSANSAADYATEAESFAHGNTGSRDGEDTDNAKYYSEKSKEYSEDWKGSLLPQGAVLFSELPVQNNIAGHLYNITDAFVTDSRFADGAGYSYPAGTNVYWTADGKWDCLSGTLTKVLTQAEYDALSETEKMNGTIYYISDNDNLLKPATDTEDGLMSLEDKTKLDGIEAGAEVNVQADWNTTDISDDSYIKNKPASFPASDVYDWAKQSTKPSYTASEVGADTSGSADTALINAKSYTDEKIADLINGAPTTLDTLGEIADAMAENKTVVEALNDAIGTKIDTINGDSYIGTTKTGTSAAITHKDVARTNTTSAASPSHGGTFTAVKSVTSDSKGHITAVDTETVTLPADTNTHYTSKNVVGSSTATSNTTTALTNGNVYLNSVENGAVTSTHKISGSGATTVTTDANGNIIISSTDTNSNTTYSAGTGLALSGTTFNHSNSVTAGTAQGDADKTLAFGGTFTIPTVTYDAQGHITSKGTTTMTMPANPNTDTYYRLRYQQAIKCGTTAIVAGNIIVGSDGLYQHLKLGQSFDITYPILYAGSAIAASSTGTNNFIVYPFTVTTTQSITLTAYKPVFIKGILSGTTFTPSGTAPLTQTVPTSEDGYDYMLLGMAYSTTAMYLTEEHPVFQYFNGSFGLMTDTTKAEKSIYGDTFVSLGRTGTVGSNSFAFGINCTASGKGSHAEGYQTTASGDYSHAEGYSWYSNMPTTLTDLEYIEKFTLEDIGTLARGQSSHAEGESTIALGDEGAHAEGYLTIAVGNETHAEGFGTMAYAICSHAEGLYATAMGYASHAEGSGNSKAFRYITAMSTNDDIQTAWNTNKFSLAKGNYSHVEGTNCLALGDCSHAEGCGTIALNYQHATGHYNNTNLATAGSLTGTTGTAFVIGNGTPTSASNAVRITYAGTVIGKAAYASTGADYAEYFEWEDGNPDMEERVGYFVTFSDGRYIKKASEGDYILGVVSGMPCVIGNNDECWTGQYEMDEWGRFIYETKTETDEETGEEYEYQTYKLNPDYDPSKPYTHREERPEWCTVGMVGVLSVRDDGTCNVNGYCKCNDNGIATACERGLDTFRVIERVNNHIIKIVLKS